MTNPKPDKETETEIIFNNSVVFDEDFRTCKNLIVKGNIDAWDIIAWNIDAWDINALNINTWNIDARDINAWNIICETRKKKSKEATTRCKIYIKNRSSYEYRQHD